MPIKISCTCGKTLSVPETMAGKQGKCPGCGKVLRVPELGEKPEKPEEPEDRPRREYKTPDLNLVPLVMTLFIIVLVAASGVILLMKKRGSKAGVFDRVREHIAKEQYVEAEDELNVVLKKHPDDAEAHALLGRSLMSRDKLKEALEELNKAIELKPDLAEALLWAGQAYLSEMDRKKVTELYKQLKAVDEERAKILLTDIQAMYPPASLLKEDPRQMAPDHQPPPPGSGGK